MFHSSVWVYASLVQRRLVRVWVATATVGVRGTTGKVREATAPVPASNAATRARTRRRRLKSSDNRRHTGRGNCRATSGNRRGTSRRSRFPVVVGDDNRRGTTNRRGNRRATSGNRRGRAENREETGEERKTRTVVVYLLLVPLGLLLGSSIHGRRRRVSTTLLLEGETVCRKNSVP